MPWKDGYTVSDERTLAEVAWPDDAVCAALVVVDLSPPCGLQGLGTRELDADPAHYGWFVALPRMLDALDRFGLRATFPVPGIVAEQAPALVRGIAGRGHEIAAHGWQREDVSALQRHEEAARLARTTQVLADVVGQRPRGWYSLPRQTDRFAGGTISANTVDLLLEAGYEYLGNSEADDIPHYWVTDFASRRAILAMPYYYHLDDQFFIEFPALGQGGTNLERPQALWRNWRAEFDAMAGTGGQRAFGRSFTMVVHPWLNGWGQRLDVFERMLQHMHGSPRVWNPTAGDCASYWRSRYPAASALRLEPSVWVDHPGSLG